MRVKQTELFQYEELSDDAKTKARDWYRTIDSGDTYFAKTTTDEFIELLEACGFVRQ